MSSDSSSLPSAHEGVGCYDYGSGRIFHFARNGEPIEVGHVNAGHFGHERFLSTETTEEHGSNQREGRSLTTDVTNSTDRTIGETKAM